MPKFMESAKSTLVISKLVRVVDALTGTERDCLAAKLGLSSYERMFIEWLEAATGSYDWNELDGDFRHRIKQFFDPSMLKVLELYVRIADCLITLNCHLDEPQEFPIDDEFASKWCLTREAFFREFPEWEDDYYGMWWKDDYAAVTKLIAVAIELDAALQ